MINFALPIASDVFFTAFQSIDCVHPKQLLVYTFDHSFKRCFFFVIKWWWRIWAAEPIGTAWKFVDVWLQEFAAYRIFYYCLFELLNLTWWEWSIIDLIINIIYSLLCRKLQNFITCVSKESHSCDKWLEARILSQCLLSHSWQICWTIVLSNCTARHYIRWSQRFLGQSWRPSFNQWSFLPSSSWFLTLRWQFTYWLSLPTLRYLSLQGHLACCLNLIWIRARSCLYVQNIAVVDIHQLLDFRMCLLRFR